MKMFNRLCAMLGVFWLSVLFVQPAVAASRGLDVQIQAQNGAKTDVRLYSASYALVIGIDNYRGGWPRLSNAVNDSRAIKQALERQGYQVTLLTDLGKRDLIDAMEEFFIVKGEDPEARLLFWFAGHGFTENNEGFIIPADGALPESGAKFRRTALPMRNVSTYVRLAVSKHVFAVFDSCFSGTVFDTSRAAPPKAITQATTRPVRQFLTSGDAYQKVSDDGTFRDIFIRALDGVEDADLNNDGYVTGTEMGFFISDRMTNLTQGRQTPRYGKLRDRNFDLGDFILTSSQASAPKTQARKPVASNNASQGMELVFWQSAEKTNTAQSYREYLKNFPNGVFSGLANERLRLLRGVITKTPAKAPKVKFKTVETQIAALPPQTTVPTTRNTSSLGGGDQWHVTAKIRGTTSCDRVPSGFEADISVSGGSFQENLKSSSGHELKVKGKFRGSSLQIGGKFGGANADEYGGVAWVFDADMNEKSPGVFQTTFTTSRNYFDCGLRVTLSLKRNN